MTELKKVSKTQKVEHTSKIVQEPEQQQEEVKPIEKSEKPKTLKGLPLQVANQRSETMSEAAVSVTAASQEETAVNVAFVPQRTATIEEVEVSEREELTKTQTELQQKAHVSFNVQQGLEIEELDIKDAQTPLLEPHKIAPEQTAKRDIVPTQAIEVSAMVAHEPLHKLDASVERHSTASTQVTTHDAVIVQETLSTHTTTSTAEAICAQQSHATETVLPTQGLQVTEVIETESESTYTREQITAIKPKYTIKPIEVMQQTEVIPEDRPGKFNPALIVATEVAKTISYPNIHTRFTKR